MLEFALFRVREMGEYSALLSCFLGASRNNFSSFVRASSSVPSLFISFFLEVHSKFANILASKKANQKHNFFAITDKQRTTHGFFTKTKKERCLEILYLSTFRPLRAVGFEPATFWSVVITLPFLPLPCVFTNPLFMRFPALSHFSSFLIFS